MKFIVLPIAREILHTTNDIAIPVRDLLEKYKSGSPICHGINFDFCTAELEKIMGVNPRKVEKIIVHMDFTGNNWDSSTLEKVIIAGKTCPVAKTIEDSVQIEFNF